MDIREFEYLIALAEEGNISKAAEKLYLAQSSLSQFLTQYEKDLGIKLFLRTGKGIKLTANGEIYMDRLRKLQMDYQRAQQELRDNENMLSGVITLGISSFRANKTLPKILKRFYELYPNVKVQVMEGDSAVLENMLLKGNLDLAVVALPANRIKHEIKFLCKDQIYLVVPKYHPVMEHAHYKKNRQGYWIDLKDTVEYQYILSDYNTVLGKYARHLFEELNLNYHAIHENITARMSAAMAMEGLGLAFTYASAIGPGDNYELLSIGEEGLFVNLGIAYPTKEYHSRAARRMEEVIREVYAHLELSSNLG